MASLNATMLRIAAFCLAQRGHHMENYGVLLLQDVKGEKKFRPVLRLRPALRHQA